VAERRTGLVYDERCLAHRNPPGGLPFGTLPDWAGVGAFERPERLTLTHRVLEGSGRLADVVVLAPRETGMEDLRRVHTERLVAATLAALDTDEPVELGSDAWTGPGSRAATLLAAGGVIAAVAAVLDGEVDNALALVRPPGHHAETDASMGFCLFNNTAIAARWAQRSHGVERVAVLDWDVHHGNGTEEIFLADASVLTVSLHQAGLYPAHTGRVGERGAGGANVNVPLPPGTGDHGYQEAFERVVEPALRRFAPDLILIGAGQDAAASDPLGRMSVTAPGFRLLADRAVALAGELCGGRLVAALEGGYSLEHLPLANLAILEGLMGVPPTFAEDPVGCDVPTALSEPARAAVAAAAQAAGL